MQMVISSFLFFLPAGIANMMPVFAAKLPVLRNWSYPVDGGLKFRGKRILGDHKTVRGFIFGTLAGTIACWVENYFGFTTGVHPILLGFLLSFGALLGDSIKSFFKRQIGIPSGKTWFPFDQLDYILGGLLGSLFVIRLSIAEYSIIFILYFCLHVLTTTLGYFLKLKDSAL